MAIPVMTFSDPMLARPRQPLPQPDIMGSVAQGLSLAQQLQKMQQQSQMAPLQREQTQAATQLAQTQSKMAPIQALIKSKQMAQQNTRFGSVYQWTKWLTSIPAAQRAAWIADNPEKFKYIQSVITQKIAQEQQQKSQPQSSGISQLLQQQFPGTFQGMPQQQPAVPQALTPQAPQPKAPQAQGVPQSLTPTQGAPVSPLTPDEHMAYIANRKATGVKMNNRANASVAMDKWLLNSRDRIAPRINNAVQYAGVAGASKAVRDQWLNKNPDAVADYQWFIGTFVTGLSNQVKKIEDMGATNEQREELTKMVDQIRNVKSNPKLARIGINRLVQTMRDLSQSNFDAAEPVHRGLYNKMTGRITWSPGNYLGDTGAPSQPSSAPQGNLVKMVKDGKQYNVPANLVDEAIQKYGATRVL